MVRMLIGKYSSSAHELLLQFRLIDHGHFCCESEATYSSTAEVSSRPCARRARGNARRRSASSRHPVVGCRCAPRPGARPAGSGMTSRPAPRSPATTRSNSRFSARCRHPMHVRTLPRTVSEDMRRPTLSRLPWRTVDQSTGCTAQRRTGRASGSVEWRGHGGPLVAPRRRLVRADVDAPAGEPCREPGVLAIHADGERELVVGNHHSCRAAREVDDLDAADPRRGQRVPDHLGGVVGEVDDVDLFAVELGHHVAHALPHRPDARPLGVDARNGGAHGKLRAMSGFARDGADLYGAVGDLWYLEREQLLDEVGVGARQQHLRAPHSLAYRDHQALDPGAVLIALAGHPLGRGEQCLEPSEVNHHVLGVAALLDDPGDDVALLAGELTELDVILGVPQTLQHDLLCGGRSDPAEAGRGVVVLRELVALLVDLGGEDRDVPGLAVQLDAGVGLRARRLVVRRQESLLDGLDEDVEGDLLLALQRAEDRHVDVHETQDSFRLNSIWTLALATLS